MILYLDTIENTSKLGLFDQNARLIDEYVFEGAGVLSEELLPNIDSFLSKNKLTKKDISAIAVNPGPGPYTGTRIGVTTGNLIAFVLNIPTIRVHGAQDIKPNIGKLPIKKLFLSPVLPIYKYPPRITKKKVD